MDLLQRLAAGMQLVVGIVSRFVIAIAGIFHVTLDGMTAEFIAILILAGFAFRLVFWPISNAKSFQPQTVVLPTAKSPWQVVAGDARGCFGAIFWVVLIFVVLYLLARAAAGS